MIFLLRIITIGIQLTKVIAVSITTHVSVRYLRRKGENWNVIEMLLFSELKWYQQQYQKPLTGPYGSNIFST